MAMTNLNIRIEQDVKVEFEKICKSMGMSMSTAFNIFAKVVIKERKIPFEIKAEDLLDSEEKK